MSGFSAGWLDLREPLDAASRAVGLCATLIPSLRQPRRRRVAIVDVGSGTGANFRYVAPLLGGAQDWLFVESDPLLQDAVEARMRSWAGSPPMQTDGCAPRIVADARDLVIQAAGFESRIRHCALDLAMQFQQLPLPPQSLLTGSALLDLVSEYWLQSLAQYAAQAQALVWFALTYDGQIDCLPTEAEDDEVRELFNLHQRKDKGFGAALGPRAGTVAEQLFAQQGYDIQRAPSPWCLGAERRALQHALVEGWFDAACEIAPHRTAALSSWLARRRAHIDAGRSELRVGHVDIVGRPRRNGA